MGGATREGEGRVGRRSALKPRRKPTQERSRQRVDVILDTVARLLLERGFDQINTRIVAERAGIPVGSIYQYFPNKYAIFVALAERYAEQIAQTCARFSPENTAHLTWEERVDQAIDTLSEFLFSANAAPTLLWAGMQNSREFRDALREDRAWGFDGVHFIVLDDPLPHVAPGLRETIARVMVRVADTLLFMAAHADDASKGVLVDELKRLLKAYVKSHQSA